MALSDIGMFFGKEWETGYCWEYIARQTRFRLCEKAPHLNCCHQYHPQDAPDPSAPNNQVSSTT